MADVRHARVRCVPTRVPISLARNNMDQSEPAPSCHAYACSRYTISLACACCQPCASSAVMVHASAPATGVGATAGATPYRRFMSSAKRATSHTHACKDMKSGCAHAWADVKRVSGGCSVQLWMRSWARVAAGTPRASTRCADTAAGAATCFRGAASPAGANSSCCIARCSTSVAPHAFVSGRVDEMFASLCVRSPNGCASTTVAAHSRAYTTHAHPHTSTAGVSTRSSPAPCPPPVSAKTSSSSCATHAISSGATHVRE